MCGMQQVRVVVLVRRWRSHAVRDLEFRVLASDAQAHDYLGVV